MNIKSTLAIFSLVAAFAAPAFGTTINFTGSNTDLGASHVYTSGSSTVTAYGFNNGGTQHDLYGKNGGGSENGLGLVDPPDNEITTTTFIQLNVSNINSNPFDLTIGSTQNVEGFDIYASNTLGTLGTKIGTYTTPGTDPYTTAFFSTADTYISIQADPGSGGNQNVLLDDLTTGTAVTPEPSSLVLLGTGMLAAAGVMRRKIGA